MYNILRLVNISLIFLFLQDCVIAMGRQIIFLASITIFVTLFFLIIKNPYYLIKQIIEIYNKTPFKYIIWFIIWMFLGALFHTEALIKISVKVFLVYCLDVIPAILFGILFFPKYFSYMKLIRFFAWIYQFIMVYGILDFLCRSIIGVKPPLYSILCSKNYFSHLFGYALNTQNVVVERASSVFFEPSFFATFIFLFIPLAYILAESKIRILKNSYRDRIFKICMILFSWLNLLFTKSPIYLVIITIYTIIFIRKKGIIFIKKYKILNILILILLLVILMCPVFKINSAEDSNNSAILRIQKTISAFGNLNTLIYVDPSFATRILTTIHTVQAVKKNPIIGCGYGNQADVMYEQYMKSQTPLTPEIIKIWIYTGEASPNIFWRTLLLTGIVGIFLLYLFFTKTIYSASKINNCFNCEELLLLKILKSVAVNYIIISFYWSLDYYPIMWFVFGLLCSYVYTYKKRTKILKLYNNEEITNEKTF